MVAKRALVVDDSKSARAFLARLLEEQLLEVDAAETAEQAIDYLGQNRPDVIFMDHLMPGMDGFQAVQAIKSNPRTAMIPILMYTSQEGELYLGQARALGAVGVLPKTVAPADVRTVLQQLHLVAQPEPPTVAEQQEVLDAAVAAEAAAADTASQHALSGTPVDELVRAEVMALRRHFAELLEAQHQRVVGDVRNLMLEMAPALPEPPLNAAEPPRHSAVPWLLALAAGIAAAVLATLLWQNQRAGSELRAELADAKSTVSLLIARLGAAPQPSETPVAALPAMPGAAGVQIVKVPFGEAALAGSRIDALREFVGRYAASGQKGTVEVRRYAGRFCLSGTSTEGFSLADAATPYIKCELVADATDPILGSAGQESVAFANALAELRKQHAELMVISVVAGRSDEAGTNYPQIGGNPPRIPTAGEWNAVAESNNRVELSWHPAT
jgi:CheY-like chemotaxis protein